MKIVLINQFFWPDSAATSQLLTDLANSLTAWGHEVTVICSDKGGYSAAADSENAPAVTIRRARSLRFARGRLGRILSYLSFYWAAALIGLALPRQDLVVTLTTPPLLSLLGTLIKLSRGSRHFIWEMDLYPDVAVDLECLKRGALTERLIGALADLSRRRADGIIVLGECMKERLIGRSMPETRIFVANNWADSRSIVPMVRPGDPQQLVLLYSGNIGLAHDFDTLLGAIEELRDEHAFRFLFAGSGCRRQEIEDSIAKHGLDSVEWRPLVRRQELGESLAAGDIGLVTQKAACCGSVVPSKVYGLLAAGRPVLFIGPAQATPARIIRQFQCGWHVEPGDITGLTSLLRRLAQHRDEIVLAGQRARQCLLDYFDLPLGVARLSAILAGQLVLNEDAPAPELVPMVPGKAA
jgi:colanic acid biosynthesis glycosyl transferase WcaI